MKLWRLQLAPHKSAQIIFSRARKFDIKEIDLVINGTKIPKDEEPKFLGIKFDRRLNFAKFIDLGTKALVPKSITLNQKF